MIDTAPDELDAIRDIVAQHLEAQRARLCAEVGQYPMPITACDVHFNRLLEERAALFADLARFAQARDAAALDAFVQSSVHCGPDLRLQVMPRLHNVNR